MKQSEKSIRDSPESVQTAVTLGPCDAVLADALAGLQVALGVLARLAAAALHAALGVPEPPVVRLHKPSVTISTVLTGCDVQLVTMQRSQRSPSTPGRHWHWPVKWSHSLVPSLSQEQGAQSFAATASP